MTMMSSEALSQHKLLIVEDEKNLGLTLYEYLSSYGLDCTHAKTCLEARKFFNAKDSSPHIVLMDINLPDGNGLELAKEFRKIKKDLILLFLSVHSGPGIRLKGLEIGADDYITKPFELKELTLRLERILSVQKKIEDFPQQINYGPLKIWFSRYEIADGKGNIIQLSQKECAILQILYQNKNKVVSRDEIINEAWGIDHFPSHRTVDNYMVKLRKWTETDTQKHISIKSIRGIGYQLTTNA